MRPIDYFLRSAALSTNDVFLKDYKTEYSYKSAEVKIRQIAQALQARGLNKMIQLLYILLTMLMQSFVFLVQF